MIKKEKNLYLLSSDELFPTTSGSESYTENTFKLPLVGVGVASGIDSEHVSLLLVESAEVNNLCERMTNTEMLKQRDSVEKMKEATTKFLSALPAAIYMNRKNYHGT